MTTIDLVLITYNRLDYTKLTLESILKDPSEEFSLTIWDNASTDGTQDFLKKLPKDSRINNIVYSDQNVGQATAVNTVWKRSKADLIGKLDNDCLLTPGWTRTLAKAHEDIPDLGVVACWHFFEDDFDLARAQHKIQRFGRHQIFRHPWTPGTGLLLKRKWFEQYGPLKGGATTQFWLALAQAGLINGFYYPLVFQEHMDDPKSKHSKLVDEQSYQEAKKITYSLKNHNQHTLADRWQWRADVIDVLLDEPWQAKHYIGNRRRLRRLSQKLVSIKRAITS